MKFQSSLDIPAPVEAAWALLLDVPAVAPCVPGAALTEVAGDGKYKGTASVRLGPVQLQFAGVVEFVEIDHAQHVARMVARGSDQKGRGNASAQVEFRLAGDDQHTAVTVDTDLQLTGSVAQYGRAEGLIKSVSNEIIRQFAENLRSLLSGEGAVPQGEALSVMAVGVGMLKSSFKKK